MKTTLPKGFKLYRARIYELGECKSLSETNLLKELSPAPPNRSKNNRMSPAGISYTYLSDKVDTCLSEIKAQIGDEVLMGGFETKRKLKILDLSIEPNFITKSIFSENYNHNENWIEDFVKHFKQEISLTIDDNKEIDYVATQVLAEYIRKIGFRGIKYESSLVKGSYNYVLFCSVNPNIIPHEYRGYGYFDYELCPFTNWLNLKSVDYDELNVSYKTLQSVKHDDDKAEYKKIEREQKKLYKKLSKGYYDSLGF